MKTLRPNRTLFAILGFGIFLVFLLGAAFWHILLDANSLDCRWTGIVCLFVPDLSDWYIHILSYALMAPLVVTLVVWLNSWRRQWTRLNTLTRNLSALEIKSSKLEKVANSLGLVDKVNLLDSADFLCFCACFTSPRIYVSRAVVESLTDVELEALLLHEKYHWKNHDPLRILLGRLTVSALFFMPVLRDLFQRYLIRMEISADQFAIRCQNNRRGIVGALQKLLQSPSLANEFGLAVSGTEALKYRIEYLARRPINEKILFSHLFFSLLIPVLVSASIVASLTVFHG